MLRVVLACLCLFCSAVCAEDTLWEFEARRWQDREVAVINGGGDEAQITRGEFYLSRHWQSTEDNSLTAFYTHQPMLIRMGEPAHNGYLHQLDLETTYNFSGTRVSIGAGIHGSSNMFKYGDFHRDAGVFQFAVLHRIQKTWGLEVGVNGDHQFGNFKVYPRVRFSQPAGRGGEIIFDLPESIVWQSGLWRLGIARYGEKWGTLNRERDIHSAIYLREWQVSSRLQLWRQTGLSVYAELGMSFNTRLEYLDLLAGWQDRRLDDSVFVTLGLNTF